MENARQPEERAGRAHQPLSCCPCLLPPSTSREEIPMQDMGPPAEGAAPQGAGVVPVAAVNPGGMIGPQQPINQGGRGTPSDHNERYADEEADMESRGRQSTILILQERPEMCTGFIVFIFMLFFYLFLGQSLNILSHELGWRGNGTEDAPILENDVIFNRTTPVSTTILNDISSG